MAVALAHLPGPDGTRPQDCPRDDDPQGDPTDHPSDHPSDDPADHPTGDITDDITADPTDDPLLTALARLPRSERPEGYGEDIDHAHQVLLSDAAVDEKKAALMLWFGRHQPCVFAKVAARANAHPALDVCWIDDTDLDRGAGHVWQRLQEARAAWKRRATEGLTSSLQVMFNSARLAHTPAGPELVDVMLILTGLYLPEWAPLEADTICLDGIPLRRPDGALELYAASMTTFFTGAHLTRTHDHRVPGGVLLNINAVGHHTSASYDTGQFPNRGAAVRRSRDTARRSVGNGGIGHPDRLRSTWHVRPGGSNEPLDSPRRPGYVPPDSDPERYGSLYHIDVTVNSLYADPEPLTGASLPPGIEKWTMMLDYFTAGETPAYHNAALLHGIPIPPDEAHGAPWKPEPRSGTELVF
ncbi:hypothetical protein J7E97_13635 [Streptomyces sp. ISL-66]|uniref:hypothetical protein n=1 Tax=Streptomyces sp. ISL-66 TaxID=2819186 RepID=UPI001BE7D561|nr:hypothetical protein [Streptomyces sp. ISL-66]MBT2468889.1 hypothetical protein [Streptomyces sp. ISL-66]